MVVQNESFRRPAPKAAIIGCGALAVKLLPSIQLLRKLGFRIVGVDCRPDPPFARFHPGVLDELVDSRDPDAWRRFVLDGATAPYDLFYMAATARAHLQTLVSCRALARLTIVTKPLTTLAHLPALESYLGRGAEAADGRIVHHDHYISKPPIAAVRGSLAEQHAHRGRFLKIRMYLLERRTVNDESDRLQALEVGQLQDMASHGLAVLQSFCPVDLEWETAQGDRYRRTGRRISVTACVEGQNHKAPFSPEVSTAVILELCVDETWCMTRPGQPPVIYPHQFKVLIVAGKGFRADIARNERDLKAVEVTFHDGSLGLIDLESNSVGGAFDSLRTRSPLYGNENQRGLNLPIQGLAGRWSGEEFAIGDDFLTTEAAMENMRLQRDAWARAGSGLSVFGYGCVDGPVPITDFVNRHAVPANGFSADWHLPQPPLHLMFGSLPSSAVA